MARTVVWVEGVDFDETMFDSNKLSVIRGACRALEEMPPLVQRELETAFPGRLKPVTIGGSKAGFVVEAEETPVSAAFEPIRKRLDEQGLVPEAVKEELDRLRDQNLVGDTALAILARAAPFVHLNFHHHIRAAASDAPKDIERAVEAARAAVRVKQLREPGRRVSYKPSLDCDRPCEFDKTRPVETTVNGPALNADVGSAVYPVSRASAARWHFGRAERQRLYESARMQLAGAGRDAEARKFAFVDDFQEMVAHPRPRMPDPQASHDRTWDIDLPVSLETKIAVFVADGDKFGATIEALKRESNAVEGQSIFTMKIAACMRELVEKLVFELSLMRDATAGADRDEASYAASLPKDATLRHKKDRKHLEPHDRLLRFETLLFGGDDVTFIVPAWLGWWLARRFFSISKDWTVAVPDNPPHPIQFSAGMVFAPAKSPIRALKTLALDLCHAAKGAGGIEVEVLESLEPPADGITGLRTKLLGKGWQDKNGRSRLTIPRDRIQTSLHELASYWAGADGAHNLLPASQLHRALRAASQAGDIASPEAAMKANDALEYYATNAGRNLNFKLDDVRCLPASVDDFAALKLHFLLQQRDYAVAGWPFANWEARP